VEGQVRGHQGLRTPPFTQRHHGGQVLPARIQANSAAGCWTGWTTRPRTEVLQRGLAEREFFDAYREAYEEAISATSTAYAPWYVVPADDKPSMRALVCGVVLYTLEQMKLAVPKADLLASRRWPRRAGAWRPSPRTERRAVVSGP